MSATASSRYSTMAPGKFSPLIGMMKLSRPFHSKYVSKQPTTSRKPSNAEPVMQSRTAQATRPTIAMTRPAFELAENAIDFRILPPSNGNMGMRLIRFRVAIQAATAAHSP